MHVISVTTMHAVNFLTTYDEVHWLPDYSLSELKG